MSSNEYGFPKLSSLPATKTPMALIRRRVDEFWHLPAVFGQLCRILREREDEPECWRGSLQSLGSWVGSVGGDILGNLGNWVVEGLRDLGGPGDVPNLGSWVVEGFGVWA